MSRSSPSIAPAHASGHDRSRLWLAESEPKRLKEYSRESADIIKRTVFDASSKTSVHVTCAAKLRRIGRVRQQSTTKA